MKLWLIGTDKWVASLSSDSSEDDFVGDIAIPPFTWFREESILGQLKLGDLLKSLRN